MLGSFQVQKEIQRSEEHTLKLLGDVFQKNNNFRIQILFFKAKGKLPFLFMITE